MTEGPRKKLVVLYVSAPPGLMGHLVPMVELGKQLVAQGLQVTVVIGVEAGADDQGVAGIVDANPSLSFHGLPAATLPSDVPPIAKFFELPRIFNRDLREFLRSAGSPAALVIDLFYSCALDVGTELGIPTYFFHGSCIANVAFSLYQPVIHEQSALSFRELGSDLVHAPGLPPIPADHLVEAMLDRDSLSNKLFLHMSQQLSNSQGVIVNSCRSLEPRATHAIVSSLCTFPGLAWYSSALAAWAGSARSRSSRSRRRWRRAGKASCGRCGLRRTTSTCCCWTTSCNGPRAGDWSVMSWAPQQQVLAHGAVGGFVTHCGWNSVLESVMAGVPMLAWPLYAEQRMNKVFLVDEMGLAAAMEGYDKDIVVADEVAAKVTWLIESDGGRELRRRAQAAKQRAEEALSDGGESKTALMNLVKRWKSTDHN